MNRNFEKIETWLKLNAEKIYNHSLCKPATQNEIIELENVIQKTLPHDFKQLYAWHNGLNDSINFGSLFYGMDFYPIERIIAEYVFKKENFTNQNIPLKKADKEIDIANMYNKNWIKFAFDGSRTHLHIDLSPSLYGQSGQIIFIDDEYETGILVAASTTELIANFANDLEQGLYHLDEDALEDGNHYLTPDDKIDLINWQLSECWKR